MAAVNSTIETLLQQLARENLRLRDIRTCVDDIINNAAQRAFAGLQRCLQQGRSSDSVATIDDPTATFRTASDILNRKSLVLLVGEDVSAKALVLNMLLGANVLPELSVPTFEIKYGAEPRILFDKEVLVLPTPATKDAAGWAPIIRGELQKQWNSLSSRRNARSSVCLEWPFSKILEAGVTFLDFPCVADNSGQITVAELQRIARAAVAIVLVDTTTEVSPVVFTTLKRVFLEESKPITAQTARARARTIRALASTTPIETPQRLPIPARASVRPNTARPAPIPQNDGESTPQAPTPAMDALAKILTAQHRTTLKPVAASREPQRMTVRSDSVARKASAKIPASAPSNVRSAPSAAASPAATSSTGVAEPKAIAPLNGDILADALFVIHVKMEGADTPQTNMDELKSRLAAFFQGELGGRAGAWSDANFANLDLRRAQPDLQSMKAGQAFAALIAFLRESFWKSIAKAVTLASEPCAAIEQQASSLLDKSKLDADKFESAKRKKSGAKQAYEDSMEVLEATFQNILERAIPDCKDKCHVVLEPTLLRESMQEELDDINMPEVDDGELSSYVQPIWDVLLATLDTALSSVFEKVLLDVKWTFVDEAKHMIERTAEKLLGVIGSLGIRMIDFKDLKTFSGHVVDRTEYFTIQQVSSFMTELPWYKRVGIAIRAPGKRASVFSSIESVFRAATNKMTVQTAQNDWPAFKEMVLDMFMNYVADEDWESSITVEEFEKIMKRDPSNVRAKVFDRLHEACSRSGELDALQERMVQNDTLREEVTRILSYATEASNGLLGLGWIAVHPQRINTEDVVVDYAHQLGVGVSGAVYRGQYHREGLPALDVVVKRLSAFSRNNPDSYAKMKKIGNEALVACQLQNPFVIGVHGVALDENGRDVLIIMEAARETLHTMLARGAVEPANAVKLLSDIASGVSSLHEMGFIHRDLKPENILIVTDPATVAKVSDFGEVRAAAEAALSGGVGTLGWQAPEVYQGAVYTQKVDTFVFGLLMWRMATANQGIAATKLLPDFSNIPKGDPDKKFLYRPPQEARKDWQRIKDVYGVGYAALAERCWDPIPECRPPWDIILLCLTQPSIVKVEELLGVRTALPGTISGRRGLRVLAMDGGGSRAIIAATVLRALEARTGKPVRELFDVIIGTSGGGLIALALTTPPNRPDKPMPDAVMSAANVVNFCERMAPAVFAKGSVGNLFKNLALYSSVALESLLVETLGCAKMEGGGTGPGQPYVAVVTKRNGASVPHVLRNFEHNVADSPFPGERGWDAATAGRATSAAPFYLPTLMQGGCIYEDGGVGFNNPAQIALLEAHCLARRDPRFEPRVDVLVSLGTGYSEVAEDIIKSVNDPTKATGGVERRFSLLRELGRKKDMILEAATSHVAVDCVLRDLCRPGGICSDTYYARFDLPIRDRELAPLDITDPKLLGRLVQQMADRLVNDVETKERYNTMCRRLLDK